MDRPIKNPLISWTYRNIPVGQLAPSIIGLLTLVMLVAVISISCNNRKGIPFGGSNYSPPVSINERGAIAFPNLYTKKLYFPVDSLLAMYGVEYANPTELDPPLPPNSLEEALYHFDRFLVHNIHGPSGTLFYDRALESGADGLWQFLYYLNANPKAAARLQERSPDSAIIFINGHNAYAIHTSLRNYAKYLRSISRRGLEAEHPEEEIVAPLNVFKKDQTKFAIAGERYSLAEMRSRARSQMPRSIFALAYSENSPQLNNRAFGCEPTPFGRCELGPDLVDEDLAISLDRFQMLFGNDVNAFHESAEAQAYRAAVGDKIADRVIGSH